MKRFLSKMGRLDSFGSRRSAVETLFEFARFLVVGAWATLLDLAVFQLLNWGTSLDADLAFVLAFTTSVICRFFVDRIFTFRYSGPDLIRQSLLYFASCTVTLFVGVGVFRLAMAISISPFVSKLISIPFVTLSGYLLFRFVVFSRKRSG